MRSLSARRAWIEIKKDRQIIKIRVVALRKESVDRNCELPSKAGELRVALRKESVDRNIDTKHFCISIIVALRKESVDRNGGSGTTVAACEQSLSARRAWIEIA
mgnify:CR=1 FL=1